MVWRARIKCRVLLFNNQMGGQRTRANQDLRTHAHLIVLAR